MKNVQLLLLLLLEDVFQQCIFLIKIENQGK